MGFCSGCVKLVLHGYQKPISADHHHRSHFAPLHFPGQGTENRLKGCFHLDSADHRNVRNHVDPREHGALKGALFTCQRSSPSQPTKIASSPKGFTGFFSSNNYVLKNLNEARSQTPSGLVDLFDPNIFSSFNPTVQFPVAIPFGARRSFRQVRARIRMLKKEIESQSPSGLVGLFDSRVGKRHCHADFRARFAGHPSFLTLHRRFYTPDSLRIQYRSCATSSARYFGAKILFSPGFFHYEYPPTSPSRSPVAGEDRTSKPVSAPARCANSGAEK